MSAKYRQPKRPTTPAPARLIQLADSLQHPAVLRTGLTTTQEGKWALLVVVKQGTAHPIEAIERSAAGYPVVYEEDAGHLPLARPAYPSLGE